MKVLTNSVKKFGVAKTREMKVRQGMPFRLGAEGRLYTSVENNKIIIIKKIKRLDKAHGRV